MTLLETLGVDLPLIQAPMAGVSSPAMAAAVSNAGALDRSSLARRMRRGLDEPLQKSGRALVALSM